MGNPSNSDVCVVGLARTPVGCFMGSLAGVSAIDLGARAIEGAMRSASIDGNDVDEVIMGNVLSAGLGQAPARQAALKAGVGISVPCTTVNKVCASGMKAFTLGCQSIQLGQNDIVIVGGMESMSNAPHYANIRSGKRYGQLNLEDGLQLDGLQDAATGAAMGTFGELCSRDYAIDRESQDRFTVESYRRAKAAQEDGKLRKEIVHVVITQKRGTVKVEQDEEPTAREVTLEGLAKLRPVFDAEMGTITAGNSSPISDGAAALVLMSYSVARKRGANVLAIVKGYADAAKSPEHFTSAPSDAIPKALRRANLSPADVDFFEINEAFAVVALANAKVLKLDLAKVNVYGGAVSIGHPLGCSGARIIVALCSILSQENGRRGVAAVCNGGGGASAVVLERML